MEEFGIRLLAFPTAVLPAVIVYIYFIIASQLRLGGEFIWTVFGFGAVSAFPVQMFAHVLESMLSLPNDPYMISLNKAFMGAAIPEETLKLIALLSVCWAERNNLSPKHIFTLTVGCACGFACFENIFYVVKGEGWHTVALLRSITAVPGHAFVGAIMGYFVARALRRSFSWLWWTLSLVTPIIFHGGYDYFLFAAENMDVRYAATVTGSIQFLTTCFIGIVLLEGILAHLALRGAHKIETDVSVAESIDPPVWQKMAESKILWVFLGLACAYGAVSFAAQGYAIDDFILRHKSDGIAAIFTFHAVTFFTLAVFLYKRNRESQQAT